MGKLMDIMHGLKPTMMMVTTQIALAGVNIFYKLAQNKGLNLPVLIAYRFIFAAATVVPLALIIERRNRPRLTWKIVFQAFVCALLGGSMAQNLYAASLVLTSATFTAAMTNLIPAMTFILAIIFRMEGLGLKTMAGKAKVVGTLMCIGGAMLLTFYKGVEINIGSTHFDLLHKSQQGGRVAITHHKTSNNVLGLLLAVGCCLSSSLSLIIQAKMSEKYPCHYSSTALITIMGSLQAVAYALCIERDWSQWKLGWNLRLLASAYMGILASGIMLVFTMSSVRMKGPLFVSVFNPLLLVLVAIAGSLFLNEKLHLGSVLGAVIIISGLYSVLWGKSKEMRKIIRLVPAQSFRDAIEVEENARSEIFKGSNHGSNIMVVAPNFVPKSTSFEGIDVEEEDIELAKVSDPQTKS